MVDEDRHTMPEVSEASTHCGETERGDWTLLDPQKGEWDALGRPCGGRGKLTERCSDGVQDQGA